MVPIPAHGADVPQPAITEWYIDEIGQIISHVRATHDACDRVLAFRVNNVWSEHDVHYAIAQLSYATMRLESARSLLIDVVCHEAVDDDDFDTPLLAERLPHPCVNENNGATKGGA